jgi:catechol 2,3-dioxygenase-like lactoylglutathione lyase family enzyme
MRINRLDHFVLTVADIEKTAVFYTTVLGMERVVFANGRIALKFGNQKINLHQADKEFEPKAAHPTPGSADLCFIIDTPLVQAMAHVAAQEVEIIKGPAARTGATGSLNSFYFRDPDHNLIELSEVH